MPLGIVNDDEFEGEIKNSVVVNDLNWSNNRANRAVVVDKTPRGRGSTKGVPPSLRKIISEEAIENGRKKGVELASAFGISAGQVDAYKNGSTSLATMNDKDVDLVKHNNEVRGRIETSSLSKIEEALNAITSDKVSELSPNKAATLAKDLVAVNKGMSSDEEDKMVGTGPNFIIYAPQVRSEKAFKVIEADE